MSTIQKKALRVKNKFISWDFFTSVMIAAAIFYILPVEVNLNFAADIYMVGITVLSMCIFYFLAFLALLVAASDEELTLRLRKDGTFDSVFSTYKYTIIVLFVGLMAAVLFYGIVNYQKYEMPTVKTQTRLYFMSFTFLFIYSILTVFEATLDSVDFLRIRVFYVADKHRKMKKASVHSAIVDSLMARQNQGTPADVAARKRETSLGTTPAAERARPKKTKIERGDTRPQKKAGKKKKKRSRE